MGTREATGEERGGTPSEHRGHVIGSECPRRVTFAHIPRSVTMALTAAETAALEAFLRSKRGMRLLIESSVTSLRDYFEPTQGARMRDGGASHGMHRQYPEKVCINSVLRGV